MHTHTHTHTHSNTHKPIHCIHIYIYDPIYTIYTKYIPMYTLKLNQNLNLPKLIN